MASASLQASLLALVLLVVVWIGRRWSPALRHAFLMIALLKFVFPPTLSLPTGLFYHVKPMAASQNTFPADVVAPIIQEALWPTEKLTAAPLPAAAAESNVGMRVPAGPMPTAPAAPMQLLTVRGWLMLLHLLGAFVILGLVVVQKFRLRQLSLCATPATDPELLQTHEDLCAAMRLVRRPRLLLSGRNHAPMTFGTWKPVVVLPADLAQALPLYELRVILGHELAHHRRRDLWLGWLQLPISMIWWFNPVFWLLAQRIRNVREDCCDDLVVSSGLATGESYCRTLLQAARVSSGKLMAGAALAYIGESQPLQRRFKRIMGNKLITAPRLAWTGIVIVILLALLFLPGIRKTSAQQNLTAPSGGELSSLPAHNLPVSVPVEPPAVNPAPRSVPGKAQTGRVVLFRVVDSSTGRGIEGASLLVGPGAVVKDMRPADASHTDKDGRCLVTAPVTGPMSSVAVKVRADGYVSRILRVLPGNVLPDQHTFKLDKGTSIGGYVHDEGGNPIENVKISISASSAMLNLSARMTDLDWFDPSVYVQTDRSGRWSCNEVLPNPERIQLTLDHPEHGTSGFSTDTTPSPIASSIIRPVSPVAMSELKEGRAILVMKNALLVAGIVMDEAGRGIGGSAVAQFEGNVPVSSVTTSKDGRFAFRVAKSGEIVLAVQAEGFAPESRPIAVAPGMLGVEFRLKKGQIVSGRVVEDKGNPVAGATIGIVFRGLDQPFSWQGETDAQGKFLWDSAPAKALWYYVRAQGYKPIEPLLLESSKEHEIRISRLGEIQVKGKVFDSQTKMPIEKFTVSALRMSEYVAKSVDGNNGEFTMILQELPEGPWTYPLLVEAAGYLPDASQWVDNKESTRYLEYALVRGSGFAGIVMLPNREPVAGANVFLCGGSGVIANNSSVPVGLMVSPIPAGENSVIGSTPSAPTMMGSFKSIRSVSGSLSGRGFTAAVVTDDSGRFSMAPVAQAHSVYATHEKGFAAMTVEQFAASSNIILRPWGRIEGTLMIGSKVGANQQVFVTPLVKTVRPPALNVSLSTQTDNDGKFVFSTLPPGEYRIGHRMGLGSGQFTIASVGSGETVSVRIGGTGRPIIGRFVITGEDVKIAWRAGLANLALKLPTEGVPRPADPAAYRDWIESEGVRARMRSERSYIPVIAPDGSFRLEDIPAGTYILTFTVPLSDPQGISPARPPSRPPERITREIVVPEMPGGRSDTPLDLGVITLQIAAKK